ncbi:MAG TPA: 4-hydroxythreonine-4-phosphate dehydrogenase PdxA [Ignavibacteria bacterium]|nr:4-hydroxythreonine-4-phosphate dehydrogenase PdxA [Ignavibacteria bacterium]
MKKKSKYNKRENKLPKIILTMGDPNGIGPEIIIKIINEISFSSEFDLKIAGAKKIFDHYSSLLKLRKIPDSKFIEMPVPAEYKTEPGKINRHAGKLAGASVKLAAKHCMSKEFDAMVTLPLSKESLNLGGIKYPGHTEMLTDITGSDNTIMILHSRKFTVALVTGHIPVSKVAKVLNGKILTEKIIAVNNSLVRDFKIKNPKINILSLNPHSGDGGMIGTEEIDLISPVIEDLNSIGFNLRGPFASDAYFANKLYGKSDITLAIYHDQGLIPFKMISFGKGVNFTAGLNIIRTSPDHGTAFDIAGMGLANTDSTKHAIAFAGDLISIRS